jgi:Phosphotransferase enzyme family
VDEAREVTLLLCASNRLLGALPPFAVDEPHWQEVRTIVATCARLHGLSVTVLRLLSVRGAEADSGGEVAYLAEVDLDDPHLSRAPLAPWQEANPLAPHALRAAYASPGGPRAAVSWAQDALMGIGRRPSGPPEQVRTWNLSSIWRIPTESGRPAWLKLAPTFYDHEGPLLELLARALPGREVAIPVVLASAKGRLLLDDIPGTDQHGADADVMADAIAELVALQQAMAGRLADLQALGLPDRRLHAAAAEVPALLDRWRGALAPQEIEVLEDLVKALPERYALTAAAGLPDTLLHGDFYQGNVRGEPGRFRILDWGDAAIGHPVIDIIRLRAFVSADQRDEVVRLWATAWRAAIPGCEPEVALAPFAPVVEFLDGLTYQAFLDNIEPDERVYHALDPLTSLRCAVEVVGGAA